MSLTLGTTALLALLCTPDMMVCRNSNMEPLRFEMADACSEAAEVLKREGEAASRKIITRCVDADRLGDPGHSAWALSALNQVVPAPERMQRTDRVTRVDQVSEDAIKSTGHTREPMSDDSLPIETAFSSPPPSPREAIIFVDRTSRYQGPSAQVRVVAYGSNGARISQYTVPAIR